MTLISQSPAKQYLLSLFSVAVVALLGVPVSIVWGYHVVPYLLLFLVSILAATMSLGPVLLASALSALIWNFFFIPPSLTFHIEKPEDILMFAMFFIIALVNGVLSAKIRQQEKLAREREKHTDALFQLTKALSAARGVDHVRLTASEKIKKYFGIEADFILQDGSNNLVLQDNMLEGGMYNETVSEFLKGVFNSNQKNETESKCLENGRYYFYLLSGTTYKPGFAVIEINSRPDQLQSALWDTFLVQISNAFEREFLADVAHKALMLDESGRLYKTLFNSVSHEFRIPVATIMAASDSLLQSKHTPAVQDALCSEILTASIRLNRLIQNLLNMSRIESGLLVLRYDWHDLTDLINTVLTELKEELKHHKVSTELPEDMPLAQFDFGLMEQTIYNILINAAQHTPAGTEIHIEVRYEAAGPQIIISDNGHGIPHKMLPHLFDRLHRVTDIKPGHTGLGLSIAKGFTEAHKGTLSVENAKDGGARFQIFFPSDKPIVPHIETQVNEHE